jgi:asparagine synthetase B (glutamine-hydrolysing)
MRKIVFDSRVKKGKIWNVKEIVAKFPFGDQDSKWNTGTEQTEEQWIDDFVYDGFCNHGKEFLKALEGRFAIVYHDIERNRIFLARDWIGEMPFHYLATETGFYFANTIYAIKEETHEDFLYENVRAFPQSHFQIIELNDIDENNIAATYRPEKRRLYYDFEKDVNEKVNEQLDVTTYDFTQLASLLKNAISKRAITEGQGMNCLLLSGGLDSLSVAVSMKSTGIPFETFSLTVDDKPGEAEMAKMFSKKLGVKHNIINITTEEIISNYEEGIWASEAYHLYNVYCTVGMLLLGQKLSELGIKNAFCGEAMNEAVGDYKDWIVYDTMQRKNVLIQKINTGRLQNIKERTLYVWGHSADKGKYNRQLGTGLAKHAGARMIKPFMQHGIELECPYYEHEFLSSIVALNPVQLKQVGYKPGLLWKIFQKDFIKFGFDEKLIKNCKKIRLQDATENGEYGISSVLITREKDQEKTLRRFNSIFNSNYNVKEKSKTLLCTS